MDDQAPSSLEAMGQWIESLPVVGAILFFWAVGILRTSIMYGICLLYTSPSPRD